ncbi:SCO family protein [Marinobacter caseinilyticus]|uniref:SCO family protein n=1 Tax=Marinobacter caseinilyticus TaxID=2692195 RepID=UPI00140D1E32|nr:SCO family protein [Marinobacter caseinilyticus]
MSSPIQRTVIALILLVVTIFGFVVAQQVMKASDQEPVPAPDLSAMNTFVYDKGRPVTPFQLTDETGKAATEADLTGHWTFAFIGYTNCPDICPATMAMLRQTDALIPADLPQPEYLLISADPANDSPDKLRDYLNFFGEDFHGLTGDLEALRALAKSLNAVFVHRESDGVTYVDHSGHLALIGPDGNMVAVLQPPHNPKAVAEAFERIYQWRKSQHPRAK